MFKIEEGIPLPPRASRGPGESKYPFVDMDIGDSFLVVANTKEGETVEKVRNRMTQACNKASKRYDVKFAARVTADGVRVWRTV